MDSLEDGERIGRDAGSFRLVGIDVHFPAEVVANPDLHLAEGPLAATVAASWLSPWNR